MSKEIVVYRGKTPGGTLVLSDGGRTKIKKGKEITWKISYQPATGYVKVVSIVAIVPKSDSNFSIFTEPPHPDGDEWKARVRNDNAVKGEVCKYAIHWKAEGDQNTYIQDPIIAVRPTTGLAPKIFVGIAVAVVALVTLQFLFNKAAHDDIRDQPGHDL